MNSQIGHAAKTPGSIKSEPKKASSDGTKNIDDLVKQALSNGAGSSGNNIPQLSAIPGASNSALGGGKGSGSFPTLSKLLATSQNAEPSNANTANDSQKTGSSTDLVEVIKQLLAALTGNNGSGTASQLNSALG